MVSATFRHLIWYIWWRCQSLVAMKSVVRKNVQDTFAPWAPVWGIHRSPWLWRSYWVDDLGTTMTTGSQSSCKRTNVMTCEDGDGISRNWWQEQAHETCSECFCCMSKLWLPVDVPFKLFSDSIQLCISGFLVTLFSLVNQSIFIVFTSKKWQRLAMVQWFTPWKPHGPTTLLLDAQGMTWLATTCGTTTECKDLDMHRGAVLRGPWVNLLKQRRASNGHEWSKFIRAAAGPLLL